MASKFNTFCDGKDEKMQDKQLKKTARDRKYSSKLYSARAGAETKQEGVKCPTHDPWFDLFNLDGTLKSQKYADEINRIARNAPVIRASSDYSEFQTDILFNYDMPHILEMYDFPVTVVTQDVRQLFKKTAFRIKWVDNTHLLLIFPTEEEAKKVLSGNCEIGKLRPLQDATPLSQFIAKRNNLVPKAGKYSH